jgi:HEXXH motif-containing protein
VSGDAGGVEAVAGRDATAPRDDRDAPASRGDGDLVGRIDWAAVAVPDVDGHGSRVARALANTRRGRWSGETALGPPRPGEPTLFAGAVAVRRAREHCHLPRYTHAPLDHPHIAIAEAHVARWPAGYALVREVVDTFNPLLDREVPPERWAQANGSGSHFDTYRFGVIYATIFDPIGLAQAFVHEAAHQKLFGLGVLIEHADRIVRNDPSRLYPSPIVVDRPRPMTAVLHAEYSFIHVAALELALLAALGDGPEDARPRAVLRSMLARNVARLTPGLQVIEAAIETDAAGDRFVGAFVPWAAQVLARARDVLA